MLETTANAKDKVPRLQRRACNEREQNTERVYVSDDHKRDSVNREIWSYFS
jgi:hypothetical protein